MATPTSNRGLEALERTRPADWYTFVWAHTPSGQFSRDTMLTECLGTTLFEAAMPRHAGDRKRIERPRRLGARLDRQAGDLRLASLDEERLAVLLDDLVDAGLFAEPARRTVSLVRGLARSWGEAMRIEARVDERPGGGGPRVGARRKRPVPTPHQVATTLHAMDPDLACFVALVIGGRLLESEARRLGPSATGRRARGRRRCRGLRDENAITGRSEALGRPPFSRAPSTEGPRRGAQAIRDSGSLRGLPPRSKIERPSVPPAHGPASTGAPPPPPGEGEGSRPPVEIRRRETLLA